MSGERDSISRGVQYILGYIVLERQYNLGYIVRGDTFSKGTIYPPTRLNILLKLPTYFLAVKMVFSCLAQTIGTSRSTFLICSMCLSKVECSLEKGLYQSTNPFFFDVHAGVFEPLQRRESHKLLGIVFL